ncbi:MAG TPA: NUDIX hydrolase [Rhizomicrobium sp.]
MAVGAVVWRGPNQLLLVRRGQPPRHGEWSIPGGGVEAGETLKEALAREIYEETGLSVEIAEMIDVVDAIGLAPDGGLEHHHILIDFTAHWRAGEAEAGSDVTMCEWVEPAAALSRVAWEETRRIIRQSALAAWQLHL